ncbi:MAG: WG repeat-containing protein [Oscillospiraceae bacterium]|nr:WG repeat-containing protein [Oscillospiraceae bacterium]
MRKKYFVLAIVMGAVSLMWTGLILKSGINISEYDECIRRAQEHEEKQAYLTAAKYYSDALGIRPDNDELMLKAAENYLRCNDENGFMHYCNMAIDKDSHNTLAYLMKSEFYENSARYTQAIDTLKSAAKKADKEKINERLEEIRYRYEEGYTSYLDMYGFYDGLSPAMNDRHKWGIVSNKGYVKMPFMFDAVGGAYNAEEDLVAVCSDSEWYMCDLKGRKKFVPDRRCTFLGTYSDGYCPFEADGVYGYIDKEYREFKKLYDFAGAFFEETAAVCLDGKWALINTDFENITEFEYDEIITDRYGFCSLNGVITAKKGGVYYELDKNGKVLKQREGDASDISYTSELLSCGLSVVQSDGRYGYADRNGMVKIDQQFEQAAAFDKSGAACVKKDGMWKIIRLYEYM